MTVFAGDIVTLTNVFYVESVETDPTTVSLAIISPGGESTTYTYPATIDRSDTGSYTADVTCQTAGRWVAVWTGTGVAADVVATSWDVVATYGTPPDLQAVLNYLGDGVSVSDDEVADALAAETAAQARTCCIPVDYPDDLGQALKRRVARNLAARASPVVTTTSFEGGTSGTRIPRLDAEIKRFEAPFPRLPVA